MTLPGTVERIIEPIHPLVAEKAQIAIDGADELYQEIRIVNTLTDEDGDTVSKQERRLPLLWKPIPPIRPKLSPTSSERWKLGGS